MAATRFENERSLTTLVHADEHGFFRLLDLPAASYTLTATAAGFSPVFREVSVRPNDHLKVDLSLEAGGNVIEGTIEDSGGGPISNASIRAHSEDAASAVFMTIADERGHYRLDLPANEFVVAASADGYSPDRRIVRAGIDRTANFRLAPASAVRGAVRLAKTGAAVAGATVELLGLLDERSTAISDGTGHFTFQDVAPGTYHLSARKGDLVGERASPITINSADVQDGLVVEVSPGRQIRGRTRDGQGVAVRGARLQAHPRGSSNSRLVQATSDADGAFVLNGLLPGKYELEGKAEGFGNARVTVDVAMEDPAPVEIVFLPGARVAGRVTDPSGNAVEGAEVLVRVSTAKDSLARILVEAGTRTSSDGRYAFSSMPAGFAHLEASHPTLGTAPSTVIALKSGEARTLDLVLQSPASLTGNVSWTDGKPAAGVPVTVMASGKRSQTLTAPDGTFVLSLVPAGTIHLMASASGAGYFIGTPTDRDAQKVLELKPNEQKIGIRLRVPREIGTISGLALDADGQPVAGATIEANGLERSATGRCTSGADGRFTLTGLSEGTFELRGRYSQLPDAVLAAVATGTKDARIQFSRGARITGVAVDGSGRPVPSFRIAALPSGVTVLGAAISQSVNAADGAFNLSGLNAGVHDLQALSADGRAGAKIRISLADGETKEVRLVLNAAATLTGKIVDLDSGAAIPDGRITVFTPFQPIERAAENDGRFAIPEMVPGRALNVGVSATGYVTDWRELTIAEGADTTDLGVVGLVRQRRQMGDVGIRTVNREGQALVKSVRPQSSAAKAGVTQGDLIVAIDGRPAARLGEGTIEALLAGDLGSAVTVTVSLPQRQPRSLALSRAALEVAQ